VIAPIDAQRQFSARNWDIYIDFICQQIATLQRGVIVYDGLMDKCIVVKGMLLMAVTDSRALPKLTNMQASPAIMGAILDIADF